MRILLIPVLFLLSLTEVIAQIPADTIYLDKNKKNVPTKSAAAYFTTTTYFNKDKTNGLEKTFLISGEKEAEHNITIDKSTGGNLSTYNGLSTSWYTNGTLKWQQNYKFGELHGKETHWYENSQIYYVAYFINGEKTGVAITYYPDGKMKRREVFNSNILIDGKCYTRTGQDTVYYPYEEQPYFPGGISEMNNFIKKNLKYPKTEKRKRISGSVLVQFEIDETGKVKNPEILKNLSPALDAESLRVIGLLPNNWEPARIDGVPVSFRYTLPVHFRLQ